MLERFIEPSTLIVYSFTPKSKPKGGRRINKNSMSTYFEGFDHIWTARSLSRQAETEVPEQPELPVKGHSRTNSRSQPSAAASASTGPGTRTRQQTSEAPSEPIKPARSTRARPKRAGKQIDEEVEVIDLAEEEEEVQEEIVDDEVVDSGRSKSSRKVKAARSETGTKSKSSRKGKKAAKSETEPETETDPVHDHENNPVVGETSQSRSHNDLVEEDVNAPKPAKKATSSKSSRKTIKSIEAEREVTESAPESDQNKPQAESLSQSHSRSASSSNSKSKTKSKDEDTAVSAEGIEEEEPKTKPARKPRTTKASSKKVGSQPEPRDPETEATPMEPAPRRPGPASPTRKPLPPLPDPSPRPLSQLERFTNLPSSPHSAPITTSNRPTKSIPTKKANSQPTRPKPVPSKAAQSIPLETGAKAARQVVDVALSTVMASATATAAKEQTSAPVSLIADGLSQGQLDMTLEQWIRAEMGMKKAEIESEGREMIKAFAERTKEGRRRIEAIPIR